MPPKIRRATHSGSWYPSAKTQLQNLLDSYNDQNKSNQDAFAIISPHAGYAYCGDVATLAYAQLITDKHEKICIFILGPSHHFYTDKCMLTRCDELETPLGNLQVDRDVTDQLSKNSQFGWLTQSQDEDEHSVEMQLPMLVHHLLKQGHDLNHVTVVPIVVGSVRNFHDCARVLMPFMTLPNAYFVVSSDFCHWGQRFRYTPTAASPGVQLWQHIQALDKEAMDLIATGNLNKFTEYLDRTGNTICGRNPICILLALMELQTRAEFQIEFLQYKQSGQCKTMSDSSVSYTAGVVRKLS